MATNYDDIIRGRSSSGAPSAGGTDYDAIIRGRSSYAPVSQPEPINPVAQAVAQTYPEAKPEPQAPQSLFSKYQKWSENTGKNIADTYLEFRKKENERIKANPSSIKLPNGDYALADPFGSVQRATEFVAAKGLNTEAAKAVTQQIYDKTSKIGLKGYARIQSLGEKTYEEAYAAAQKRAVDPTNNQLERLMYGVADSGLQSVVIAGISLAAGAITKSPTVGKTVAAGLFGSVATEAERMDKGSITPTGVRNIAIDTYGDMVISNWAEKALAGFGAKTSAKFLTKEGLKTFSKSFMKAFGVEGSTEVVQSFAKYGNEYASANTPQERAAVVEKFKQYVVSGAMMDEFLIGGVSGGIISGGVEVAGRAGLGKADPTQQMGIQPKPKFTSTGKDDDEIKKTAKESGLTDDITNALETNSREEVISELQTQLNVSSTAASQLVQEATTPEPQSEEDIAIELQALRDNVTRSVTLQKQSTGEIVSRTEELIQQAQEATAAEINDLEDELKAIRAELAKRKEPEAKLAEEAISLIPAPKDAKVTELPQAPEPGDAVKIKTLATGVARDAEVVEVRDDGVVATVKGDKHFPEIPMFYRTTQFTAIPRAPKEGTPSYAEWKAREAAKRRARAEAQAAKVPEYREKAEKAKKTPAIAEAFTRKADEIEGKKPLKAPKKEAVKKQAAEPQKETPPTPPKQKAGKVTRDMIENTLRNKPESEGKFDSNEADAIEKLIAEGKTLSEAMDEVGKKEDHIAGAGKKVETDASRVQEIKNSIAEGEMILKSGKTIEGRKMSEDELAAVKRTIASDKTKIGEEITPQFARKDDHIDEDFRLAVAKGLEEMTSEDFVVNGKIDQNLMQEVEHLIEGFNAAQDTAEDVRRGAEILAPLGKLKEFMQLDFARKEELTTTLLQKLEGRATVSKQFISDLTNAPDMKQAEKELIRSMLEGEGSQINVPDFINKVKAELLPLTVKRADNADYARYENIVLPEKARGPVANYAEKVYQSPIKTSAGQVHFSDYSYDVPTAPNYFAHTRIEDMADGKTRRVIEAQSDLFQKGRLESEGGHWSFLEGNESFADYAKRTGKTMEEVTKMREKELEPLQPYRNTWQDRIIREEVRQAAIDGKTKLQFPTGETAMKIEGLGNATLWVNSVDTNHVVQINELTVGKEITESRFNGAGNETLGARWVITDVLGDGKFKANHKGEGRDLVDGKIYLGDAALGYNKIVDGKAYMGSRTETFDVSGKMDTENPIYKFYEKEVGRYLKNRYGAERVTDAQGVEWYEVNITPDMAGPVLAFKTQDLEDHLHDAAAGPMADSEYGRQVLAGIKERMKYDFNVTWTDNILTGEYDKAVYAMSGKKEDVEAWGVTMGKEIAIAKGAPVRVLPHEALGHFTINNLDKMESEFGMSRMELLTARNGGKTPITSKEEQKIAESIVHDFEAVWEANERGEAHTFTGVVGRFYDRLIAFIKGMLDIRLTDRELLRQFYDKLLYMRRSGPTITDRAYDLGRFETAPGVLNFGVHGDFAKKQQVPEWQKDVKGGYMMGKDDLRDVGIPPIAATHGAASVYKIKDKWAFAFSFSEGALAGFGVSKDFRGMGIASHVITKMANSDGTGTLEVYDPNSDMMAVLTKLGKVSTPDGRGIVTLTLKKSLVETPDFMRKEVSLEEFDALPDDEQRALMAQEIMDDVNSGGELYVPYETEVVNDLLSGKRHIRVGRDTKEWRQDLGSAIYARVFRRDSGMAFDEILEEIRSGTGKDFSENDLLDALKERSAARNLALEEQKEIRRRAREARSAEIAKAKTEAEKVKVMKAIERDLTKRLLEKKATIKDLGQKMGVSRLQKRTREQLGVEAADLPYQKVTKAGEQAKAEAYYDANKDKTIGMALGTETMPDDVTQNAISIAVIQKAQSQGDAATVAQALPKLSLRSTRFGQEISMLRDFFNDRDPVAYMAKVLSYRKLLVQKHFKPTFTTMKSAKSFETIVEEKVKKAREKAPRLASELEIKGKQIDDFLEALAC